MSGLVAGSLEAISVIEGISMVDAFLLASHVLHQQELLCKNQSDTEIPQFRYSGNFN
jgi:hypothetical protein